MKPFALSPKLFNYHYAVSPTTSISCPTRSPTQFISPTSRFKSPRIGFTVCCSNNATESVTQLKIGIGSPTVPSFVRGTKLSLSDQAFYLLAFIACTTSIAFTSLVVAAVPALYV